MGVFLLVSHRDSKGDCLPHARGGVSTGVGELYGHGIVFPTPVGVFLEFARISAGPVRSSPRPWGCFHCHIGSPRRTAVFPTPVGVFLNCVRRLLSSVGLPHARGGVSLVLMQLLLILKSSPTPRGYTYIYSDELNEQIACLPHARGGVSPSSQARALTVRSSPRPWGCFLGRDP